MLSVATSLRSTLFPGLLAMAGALTILLASPALAADINFESDTAFSLSAENVDFTVLAGSSADTFTVNATSVVIGVTNGTSSATLTSTDANFTATGDATINQTCSGDPGTAGTATITISGTGTATLAAASRCLLPALVRVGPMVPEATAPKEVAAPKPPPTEVAESVLLKRISMLRRIITNLRLRVHISRLQRASGGDLYLGKRDEGVELLQSFLTSKGVGPAAEKLKGVGATGFFGRLTQAALAEYQKNIGVEPTGYFGPLTRKYIAEKEVEPLSP